MDISGVYTPTITTQEETLNFIGALWYQWGINLVNRIAKEYELSEEQNDALMEVLLKSNDWCVELVD